MLGGDGYLGWPTAMAFSRPGTRVAVVDNFAKRQWELELGVRPLFPIPTLHERVRAWREVTEHEIELFVGDLTDYAFVESVDRRLPARHDRPLRRAAVGALLDDRRPARDLHPGEQRHRQPQRPVRDPRHRSPETHLVKLGTMGEYGTPDIDIEEGYLTVDHNGRQHTFLYPKTPGSMYHLSKVHDSHNIHFATPDLGPPRDRPQPGRRVRRRDRRVGARPAPRDELPLRRGLRHGAQPLLRPGGHRPPAHGLRQGRPDPRLPEHPRHDRSASRSPSRTRPTRASSASTTSSPSSSASSSSRSGSSTAAEHLGWSVDDRAHDEPAQGARGALLQRPAHRSCSSWAWSRTCSARS